MPERPLDLWEEEPLRSMLLPVKVVEAWGSGYPPEVYVSIVDGNDRRIGMTFRYNDLNPWTAYPDAMMKLTTQEAEPRWKARVPGGFFGV